MEIFLATLMKNNFSFYKHLKRHQKFLLCKLTFLAYPYTLDYKKILLTILSISYTDYHKFSLCKLLAHNSKNKLHSLPETVSMVYRKNSCCHVKYKKSQLKRKILTMIKREKSKKAKVILSIIFILLIYQTTKINLDIVCRLI